MNRKYIAALAAVAFALALCVAVVPVSDESSAEPTTSTEMFVEEVNGVIDKVVTSADPENPFIEVVDEKNGNVNLVLDLYAYQSAKIDANGISDILWNAAKDWSITVEGIELVTDGEFSQDGLIDFISMNIRDVYNSLGGIETAKSQVICDYALTIGYGEMETEKIKLAYVVDNVNGKVVGFLNNLADVFTLSDQSGPVISMNVYNVYDEVTIKETLDSLKRFTSDQIFGAEYGYMYNMAFGTLIGLSNAANSVTFTAGEYNFNLTKYVTGAGVDNFQRLINGLINSMESNGWNEDMAKFKTGDGTYSISGNVSVYNGYMTFEFPLTLEIVSLSNVENSLLYGDDHGNKVYAVPTIDPKCVALGVKVAENYTLETLTITIGEKVQNIMMTKSFVIPDSGTYTFNAVFKEIIEPATYTVTYNGNDNTAGTVPVDENVYTAGQDATVLGKGNLVKDGYEFTGWNTMVNGSGTAYAVGDKIPMNSDVTLYAQWNPITTMYKVTITDPSDGTIHADKSEVPKGGSVTFSIVAENNFKVSDAKVNGNSVGAVVVYTLTNVQADVTVTATFESAPGYETIYDNGTVTEKYTEDGANIQKSTDKDGDVSAFVTVGTITANATVNDSSAIVTNPTKDNMSNAADAAIKAAAVTGCTATPVVIINASNGETVLNDTLQGLKDKDVDLRISDSNAAIKFDKDAVQTLAGKDGNIKISVGQGKKADLNDKQKDAVGDNVFFNFGIHVGDQVLSDFGGKADVEMQYEKQNADASVVVHYVDDNGNKEKIDSTYTNGKVKMTLSHFSVYMISEETEPEPSGGSDNTMWIIVGVIAAIVVIGVVAYFYMKRN